MAWGCDRPRLRKGIEINTEAKHRILLMDDESAITDHLAPFLYGGPDLMEDCSLLIYAATRLSWVRR
jgi:hypothetical protein